MEKMRVRLTFKEQVLGTASADPELHSRFIASKSPDAATIEDEVAALGAEAVEQKAMTVFPKEDGKPFIYDYQIKGFFKNACKAMREVDKSASSKLKAYKTKIDNLVFVDERKILFENPNGGEIEIGNLQRPLRASTAQGERIALANSESVPAGTEVEFTITTLVPEMMAQVQEWLDYGALNGLGCWHNSGCGRFTWKDVS